MTQFWGETGANWVQMKDFSAFHIPVYDEYIWDSKDTSDQFASGAKQILKNDGGNEKIFYREWEREKCSRLKS